MVVLQSCAESAPYPAESAPYPLLHAGAARQGGACGRSDPVCSNSACVRRVRGVMLSAVGGLSGCVGAAQAQGAPGAANGEDDGDAFGGIERDSPIDLLGGRGEVPTEQSDV